MSWNPIDIALVLLIGLSTLGGLAHGFSRLVVGTAAAILGILLGFWFYGLAAAPLMPYMSHKELAYALGFLIILGGCMVLGAILGRMLASLFRWVGLSWIDRLLGGAAGFARGAILAVALTMVVLACSPGPPPAVILNSRLMPYVMQASRVLAAATPAQLRQAFEDARQRIRAIHERQPPPVRRVDNRV